MSFDSKFINLKSPNNIWTISAINGQVNNLKSIHQHIWDEFKAGDKLIYFGNYLGSNSIQQISVIDEIINFRESLTTKDNILEEDFIYLRGVKEEIWQKLLQLQFAPSPASVFDWMIEQGMGNILKAYGTSIDEGNLAIREGTASIAKWTNSIRSNIRENHVGHDKFGSILKRAAFTDNNDKDSNILFVHSGINDNRPLTNQGDSFWWDSQKFDNISKPYDPFTKIIRGFDPKGQGIQLKNFSISLDENCGYGGLLLCSQISNIGEIKNIIKK